MIPVLLTFALAIPLQDPVPEGVNEEAEVARLESARGQRFRLLLARLEAPSDRGRHPDGFVAGARIACTYAGIEVPTGHWVWVEPYWYVWRDDLRRPSTPRPWGSEQVTGAPDTPTPGDQQTAWASATQDVREEWLLVEFATPVVPSAIKVYETYHPGALRRAHLVTLDGTLLLAWSGTDPIPTESPMGIAHLPATSDRRIGWVWLEIDSTAVAGWNEIDAIGLVDEHGRTHWPIAAMASSEYADQADLRYDVPVFLQRPGDEATPREPTEQERLALMREQAEARTLQIRSLETQETDLKREIESLQSQLRSVQRELESHRLGAASDHGSDRTSDQPKETPR